MMKLKCGKQVSVLAALLVLGSLMGCSLQQDPYAGNDLAQKGIPPEKLEKPEPPKPIDEKAIRIDSNDFYVFKVGEEKEISISGRVLTPVNGNEKPQLGQDYFLEVTNLQDFDGASFDSQTGVFKWKPTRVPAGAGYAKDLHLDVRLTVKSGTPEGRIKNILIYVERAEVDPQIVSITGLENPPLRVGREREFTVVVTDPDGEDADEMRPRLLAMRVNRTGDISGLISLKTPYWGESNPTPDPNDPKKWVFKMILDLNGDPVTDYSRSFTFGLEVASRFGRTGHSSKTVTIYGNVMQPAMSWGGAVDVYEGQFNVINFTVYDPKKAGQINVTFDNCSALPGAATCDCVVQPDGSQQCAIRWQVPSQTAGTSYRIKGRARNQNRISTSDYAELAFDKTINVLPNPNAPVATLRGER